MKEGKKKPHRTGKHSPVFLVNERHHSSGVLRREGMNRNGYKSARRQTQIHTERERETLEGGK